MPSARLTVRRRAASPRIHIAIALFCLVLTMTIWAATSQRIGFERDEAIANAIRENSNLAMAFEEQTARTLRAAEQVTRFVRHEYGRLGARMDIARYIRQGVVMEKIFTIVSVVDERGDIVLSTRRTGPVSYADRPFFTVHRERPGQPLYINEPVFGRVSSTWQIPMSLRIDRPDGRFGGVVVLSVDPAFFAGFYQQADLGSLGMVALVGLDGKVRARRVGRLETYGQDMAKGEELARQAHAPTGNYIGIDSFDGVRRLYSYRTVEGYPLIAMVATAESEVLAPFHQRERNYRALAIVATLLIWGFGLFLMAALSRQRRAVAALAESEARMAHQAQHDSLTQLPNRALCRERLQQGLAHARRRSKAVGLLYIDVDGFKAVNDSLGHAVGDRLLEQVAARLRHCVRGEDTVGRLGGDEFSIILSEVARAEDCAVVAAKVVQALAEPFPLEGHEVRVSASVGIATYPEHGDDVEALLRHADMAMFRAKKTGKNAYCFYS